MSTQEIIALFNKIDNIALSLMGFGLVTIIATITTSKSIHDRYTAFPTLFYSAIGVIIAGIIIIIIAATLCRNRFEKVK
jgi:NADH:ubiquinone oxidoreductase subunit 2 (subunit N)